MSLTRDDIEELEELHPLWSDVAIARYLNIHVQTVRKIRRWGSAANANRYYQAMAAARRETAAATHDVIEEVRDKITAETASDRFLADLAKYHQRPVARGPDAAPLLPRTFHPEPAVQRDSALCGAG
jgi:IS30 family transposase